MSDTPQHRLWSTDQPDIVLDANPKGLARSILFTIVTLYNQYERKKQQNVVFLFGLKQPMPIDMAGSYCT